MNFGESFLNGFHSRLVVCLAVLAFTTPALSAQTSFLVEFDNKKLSVKGDSIPVKDLLLEIQDRTGILVNFISSPTGTVTLDIDEQSVEQVIAKISDNHMIIHDTVDGLKTIKELVYISGATEVASVAATSEFLPSGEPAPSIAVVTPGTEDAQASDEKL